MKTFNEFVEYKRLEKMINEAAELMVKLDLDPAQYILSYVSNDPKVETALLEYIEMKEGVFDGMVDFGTRAYNAGKEFIGNVWKGGGVTGGAAKAADTMMGPRAKFNTAKRVLGDLLDSLKNNDQTKNMKTDAGGSLTDYIQKVINDLTAQERMIPILTQKIGQARMRQTP
jgi:hypothetical protein